MKRLVVYYSYTGNTRQIAERVKDKLNCYTLELEPKIPFSTDYDTVVNEYQNNSIENKLIDIKDFNLDLNCYDEIILGTPVWWYSICHVVASFLKKYDLSNKTIYPYATNAGWLGHTFNDIKKLCYNSNVKYEQNIVFESYSTTLKTSENDIDKWIEKIRGENKND